MKIPPQKSALRNLAFLLALALMLEIAASPQTAFASRKSHASAKPTKTAKKAIQSEQYDEDEVDGEDSGMVIPGVKLSAILKSHQSGLDGGALNGDQVHKLRDQAEAFIRFRRGKMPAKAKLQWVAECLKHSKENPYCEHLVDHRILSRSGNSANAKEEALKSDSEINRLYQKLMAQESQAFENIQQGLIHKVLKVFTIWDPLQGIADKVLKSETCAPTTLLTALGQKAEEFFPDPKFKDLSQALFQKSIDCSKGKLTDDAATKARYRLGLISIWANDCKRAEPLLAPLSTQKDGDYNYRAIYWRTQCARKLGNNALAEELQAKLLKDYPLTYHGLLSANDQSSARKSLLGRGELSAQFRSKEKPEINAQISAIEMLQRMNSHELATELLDSLTEKLEGTELGVKLYTAVLMQRSESNIPRFKLLSSLFHENPTNLTRSTLELFYPLEKFEIIRHYGSKLDPYLIAALIRQESGFNSHARSMVGAMGLMQLMPETAQKMERVSRRELLDAKTNVRLGVKYFHTLVEKYDFDAELALAAYNAGPDKVDDWKKRYPTEDRMLFFDLIPFAETRNYVALISRNYFWYLSLYSQTAMKQRAPSLKATSALKKPLMFTMFKSL